MTTPSYFLSLALEGVRCFGPQQTLDLSDGEGRPARWTLILGENGTGKTTLLQTLGELRLRQVKDGTKTNLDTALEGWSRSWKRLDGSPAGLRAAYFSEALAGIGFQAQVRVKGLFEGDVRFSEFDNLRVVLFQNFFLIGYGATRRISGTDIKPSEQADPTATLFDPDARLLNAEELLLRLDYRALQQKRQGAAQRRLEQVTEMLRALLPDVDDITLQPDEGNGSIRSGLENSVRFKTPYGWVPLSGLSLGYQTMIAWTVDLASRLFDRYPDSPDPLKEHAVVLVDEIDLHLHPRWQRDIMAYLSERFPAVQFIATAHSPLIVQAAGEFGANVVVLRREGDHVVIDNEPDLVAGWRVDQILASDLFTGVDSARGPQTEAKLAERRRLLQKKARTPDEEQRLDELNGWEKRLPTATSSGDQEAMDLLRHFADQIRAPKP